MKALIKSKLVLTLEALVMIVAAISMPLLSSSVRIYAQGTVTITEFPVPTTSFSLIDITSGPDGNLWFTDQTANQIGRITPTGAVTEFTIPTVNSSPHSITAGSDGNLWFTESNPNLAVNQIGRITPTGVITEFPLPTGGSNLLGITAGPDGNLWFTVREANRIGRITPTGAITEFPLPIASTFPEAITAGSDGNLWFTQPTGDGNTQIGRITPTGAITEFPILPVGGRNLEGITSGPDGNLWFTEFSAQGSQIGRITPAGAITQFPVPTVNGQPHGITSGPDGNFWFTEDNPTLTAHQIGRITPTGAITEFTLPTVNGLPFGITSGPDGNLWFVETAVSKIGRINLTATNQPPSLNALSNVTINEGDIYTANGSFTDPDSTSWTATVDYGDSSGVQPLTLNPDNTFSLNHAYKDNGTYTVTVRVTDDQEATGTGIAQVTVNNVSPTVGTISVSPNPVQFNTAVTASANFTDPGVLDTHRASWNWGDGNTTTGTVTETNGSGSVSDTHTYSNTGVYTITLTVTDKDNEQGTQTFQYVSVYNPTAQGLFSAGQHFSSPAGAYPQNPNLTGTVKFGLSYKYQGNMPVGDRQFTMDFKAANLTFNATTINALVIFNGFATLTGTGTINGSGSYNFLVTGVDGGGIRIQITDPSNNNIVIYDTQPGATATATPSTSVTGNVLVH